MKGRFEGILETIGNTPLVEIRKLNPNPNVKIFAKLESFNPGGSVKDRPALYMIERAEERGELTRDDANGNDLPVNPWLLVRAALSVVSSKAARAGTGTAHRLLRANGPLTPFLKDRPLDEQANELLDTFRRRPSRARCSCNCRCSSTRSASRSCRTRCWR